MKRSGGRSRESRRGHALFTSLAEFVSRRTGRLTVVMSVCCAAVLAGAPAVALSAGSTSASSASPGGSPVGGGSGASSALGGALVTPGSLAQGEEARAAEEARRSSPEAVAARERSRTAFAGLSASAAAKLADEAFPEVVDRRAGSLPRLPSGQEVVGYPTDNAAQVDLPGGKHGVIEATEPIAIETSRGRHEPLDLGLTETGGGFQPARSATALHIPKRLADGVRLASTGVSLTPVGANGSALGGSEGVIDGASVLYANTQTDSDTVVKPLASGFEEDTLLRSVDSPSTLSFRVGLPAGASLVPAKDGAKNGSGGVDVVEDGTAIAVVLAPGAMDAEGTVVPVSMSMSGDTLTVNVDQRAGEYRYPIEVDPTVVEKKLDGKGELGNWTFTAGPGGVFYETRAIAESLGIADSGTKFKAGEYGYLQYKTEGESRIYNFRIYTWTGEDIYNTSAAFMAIAGSSYEGGSPKEIPASSCCEKKWYEVAASGSNGNSALYESTATSSGHGLAAEYYFEHVMDDAEVAIAQEKGPSASWDTSEEIYEYNGEKYENALYGSRWVNDTSGKWDVVATGIDPGLGMEKIIFSSPNAPKWGVTWPSYTCEGVQCKPSQTSGVSVKGETETLPEGEDTVEAEAVDPVDLTAKTSAKVKIDNIPPHSIAISGLGSGNQIGEREYNLKVEATDGSGSTPSSGVAFRVTGEDPT